MKERQDDFDKRRTQLKNMTDAELKAYFYELSDKIVDPFMELGEHYTSKSVERSVLLRMGFSSIEAKKIVDMLNENNLLRKGAGHCVYRVARDNQISIRDAGHQIAEGKAIDTLLEVFSNHA